MILTKTLLEGCYILEPKVYQDHRGYFFEAFNKKSFEDITGQRIHFVQDNQSYSTKGVLRGLHFQSGKFAQSKLVRVLVGEVIDIVVDIRPKSNTFGKHLSIKLSEKNKKQLFIPRGFAHGFVVISSVAVFLYKCDNFYDKNSEKGIIYSDPFLNIDWKLSKDDIIISEKDKRLPLFSELDIYSL